MQLTHIIEDAAGNLMVRWIKDDGVPHRAVVPVGESVEAVIASVEKHMQKLGLSAPESKDTQDVQAVATVAWTPEKIALAETRK